MGLGDYQVLSYNAAMQAHVHAGETWGKRQTDGSFVRYLVLECQGELMTLQNLARRCSVFRTRTEYLLRNGYERLAHMPYIDLDARRPRLKPRRCPRTFDFIEGRADAELPR